MEFFKFAIFVVLALVIAAAIFWPRKKAEPVNPAGKPRKPRKPRAPKADQPQA